MPKKPDRNMNWATIIYPESAPSDWMDKLKLYHVPFYRSPLHLGGLDGASKNHYHVMVMFSSLKSFDQAKTLFESIGGVGAESVVSRCGYARYLCHLDDKDKHQYSSEDVFEYSASYSDDIESPSDRDICIAEMEQFIDDNCILSFREFCQYCRSQNSVWYHYILTNCREHILAYIRSLEYDIRHSNSLLRMRNEFLSEGKKDVSV